MSPDLVLRYRHQPATALPHFVGKSDAEDMASQVRRQLGLDDADAPALSLARLTEIGVIRVNGVALDLIWSPTTRLRTAMATWYWGLRARSGYPGLR